MDINRLRAVVYRDVVGIIVYNEKMGEEGVGEVILKTSITATFTTIIEDNEVTKYFNLPVSDTEDQSHVKAN